MPAAGKLDNDLEIAEEAPGAPSEAQSDHQYPIEDNIHNGLDNLVVVV